MACSDLYSRDKWIALLGPRAACQRVLQFCQQLQAMQWRHPIIMVSCTVQAIFNIHIQVSKIMTAQQHMSLVAQLADL